MAQRVRLLRHDGLTFEVGDDGPLDGEAIVLLHGFPDTRRVWRHVTPLLVDAGFRVLTPDTRGDTRATCPDRAAGYRVDRAALDVVALAAAAGIERIHVVGHDWGGAIAWQLASDRPDLVATLTVLSTPHPGAMVASLTRSTQALKSAYFVVFTLPVLPEAVLRARHFSVLARGLSESGMPEGDVAEVVDRLDDPVLLRGALGWYRGVRRHRPSVGTITVPTLFAWGDGDVALGRAAAVGTARFVAGRYRFVPLEGHTHWLPHEAPELVAELVATSVTDRLR